MWSRLAAAVATLVISGGLHTPPAHADEEHVQIGFASTVICVVRVDPALGWYAATAMRRWNESQDAVHFSNVAVPGCSVVEVHEYDDPDGRISDAESGYVDWPRWGEGAWVDGVWRVNHAEVWLNRGVVKPMLRNKHWKGTRAARCILTSIVAHELGHTLGLGHTTGRSSVMSTERNNKRHCGWPSEDDVAAVEALY